MTDTSATCRPPLRGWSKAVTARQKNSLSRIAAACASAVVFAPIAGTVTTLGWLAASLMMLGIERWIVRPARGEGLRGPRGLTGFMCDSVLFMTAAVFSWIAVPLWFVSGLMGGICATIFLGGSLLLSVSHGAGSLRVTALTVAPSAAIALCIPWLLNLNGADNNVITAASIAVLVFLAISCATARRLRISDDEQARAFDMAEARRRQAEQAMDSRAAYLSMIAHDLRTPITAILAGTDSIALDTRGGHTPSPQKLALIRDAGLMMQALLDDLLDHARIDAGSLSLNEQAFDLRRTLIQSARLWATPVRSKGLRLVIDAPRNLPRAVIGDEMRLRQVINNLLSNAVKFTATGTVTLRARCWLDDRGEHALTLEVADTGPGMSASRQARLFRRFDQTADDIATRFGGSGLGLSISHDLARLMNGRLTVRSIEGTGTIFTLALTLAPAEPGAVARPATQPAQSDTLARITPGPAPLAHNGPAQTAPALSPPKAQEQAQAQAQAQAKTASLPPEPEEDEIDAAPLRVLVVDDHEINRRAIQLILQPFDCDITVAADGLSALELAATNVFDVIFMDVRMPELDGRETTRRLRAAGGPNLNTPVIAVTADNSPEDQSACLAAGMNAFVAKPLSPATLVAALQDALDAHQARAAA